MTDEEKAQNPMILAGKLLEQIEALESIPYETLERNPYYGKSSKLLGVGLGSDEKMNLSLLKGALKAVKNCKTESIHVEFADILLNLNKGIAEANAKNSYILAGAHPPFTNDYTKIPHEFNTKIVKELTQILSAVAENLIDWSPEQEKTVNKSLLQR